MNNKFCPKCGMSIQENAKFCPHCMTSFEEKQHIDKPKSTQMKRKRTLKAILCCALAVIILICGSIGIVNHKKHSPICTYSTFLEAIPKTSERLGLDDLWDVGEFKDVMGYNNKKTIRYTTKVNIDTVNFSLFFYNKGEEISAYISDVDSSNEEDCTKILISIVQAVCNNYFSDIGDFFTDRKTYPFRSSEKKYDTDFTDKLGLSENYENDIKSGATFKSEYITAQADKNIYIEYAKTTRVYNDKTLYDLSTTIYKA